MANQHFGLKTQHDFVDLRYCVSLFYQLLVFFFFVTVFFYSSIILIINGAMRNSVDLFVRWFDAFEREPYDKSSNKLSSMILLSRGIAFSASNSRINCDHLVQTSSTLVEEWLKSSLHLWCVDRVYGRLNRILQLYLQYARWLELRRMRQTIINFRCSMVFLNLIAVQIQHPRCVSGSFSCNKSK